MRRRLSVWAIACAGSILLVSFFAGRDRFEGNGSLSTSKPQAGSLTVYTFPKYLPADVLNEFKALTGIAVRYESFEMEAEMRAKVASNPGSYDVIIDDSRLVRDLEHLGMIRSFQTSKLPGLAQLDPRFGNVDPKASSLLFVPYLWGSTIAAYRTDKLTLSEADKSWSLFWDERVRNNAALIEWSTDIFAVGLASLGYAPDSQDKGFCLRAEEHLRRAIQGNGVEIGGSWSNLDRLASGDRWLVHCYSGDAAMCAAEHENIGYFLPKEGTEIWLDGFMLCSDSLHQEAAHRFVAFMLRPDVAVRCANYAWQPTPNRAAALKVDPKLLADKVLNPPPEFLDRCSFGAAKDDPEWLAMLQSGMRKLQEMAEVAKKEKLASKSHLTAGSSN
jgi:spermidine/putrescine transport system substrate-binding protein